MHNAFASGSPFAITSRCGSMGVSDHHTPLLVKPHSPANPGLAGTDLGCGKTFFSESLATPHCTPEVNDVYPHSVLTPLSQSENDLHCTTSSSRLWFKNHDFRGAFKRSIILTSDDVIAPAVVSSKASRTWVEFKASSFPEST